MTAQRRGKWLQAALQVDPRQILLLKKNAINYFFLLIYMYNETFCGWLPPISLLGCACTPRLKSRKWLEKEQTSLQQASQLHGLHSDLLFSFWPPALIGFLVVPNVFHLRIMEDTDNSVQQKCLLKVCTSSLSSVDGSWPHARLLLWYAWWAVRPVIQRWALFQLIFKQVKFLQVVTGRNISEKIKRNWKLLSYISAQSCTK